VTGSGCGTIQGADWHSSDGPEKMTQIFVGAVSV